MGKQWIQWQSLFGGDLKSLQMVTAAMKVKDACSLEEKLWPTKQHLKKHRHYFANKGASSQSYGFSSSHVWMWKLDSKESWAPKNWCFWTVVLKTLESPLDSKEIQPVNSKGNQSWIFIGRTDADAKAPIFWPPDAKNWLIRCWKRLMAGGEGDDRGWDGWMASPTRWTWVWASSGSWWWTGKPGVLQSMGSQRVGHDWVTELNWTGRENIGHWPSQVGLLRERNQYNWVSNSEHKQSS